MRTWELEESKVKLNSKWIMSKFKYDDMNFSNLIYKLSLSNNENEVFEVSTSFVYTKVITQQSVNKHFENSLHNKMN